LDYPLSLNRYVYAYDNPMRFVDPSGHVPMVPQLTASYQRSYDKWWNALTPQGQEEIQIGVVLLTATILGAVLLAPVLLFAGAAILSTIVAVGGTALGLAADDESAALSDEQQAVLDKMDTAHFNPEEVLDKDFGKHIIRQQEFLDLWNYQNKDDYLAGARSFIARGVLGEEDIQILPRAGGDLEFFHPITGEFATYSPEDNIIRTYFVTKEPWTPISYWLNEWEKQIS